MTEKTKVHIRVNEGGTIPVCQSEHSAGYDLFAPIDMVIRPGETKLIPMNFVMALEPDVEAQVRPRSGLSLKTTLRIPNAPGTIDSDYRDQVGVIIENTFNQANIPFMAFVDRDFEKKLKDDYTQKEFYGQKIFLDKNNNPCGTIYINKGDRIAQLIFARYLRVDFIEHERPEEIGFNRGGGFGHSGK